ncbi:Lysine methyltransferase [Trema orientale]|uniref:Lysine methyltransferase n=1 Tax=Trema orientale TaxID=63057 RepID=A0A2P5BHZ1_TREOI|nr:Lysine methyltransferase [Trema orientale]
MVMREIQVADQSLVVFELDDLCDSVTGRALTGAWVWDSALVLAEWLAAAQDQLEFSLRGKSVIELGAGAGLPGLAAALLGASRVVLTDVGALIPGLRKNVEANGLGDRVEVSELVWGSDESVGELGEFELVLMSDVFFDAEDMAALAKTLRKVCKRGTRIWAASEGRPWTGECLNELEKEGFGIVELASELAPLVGAKEESDSVSLYSLIPPYVGDNVIAVGVSEFVTNMEPNNYE